MKATLAKAGLRGASLLLLAFVFLTGTGAASAQTTPARDTTLATYRIRVGDVVRIRLWLSNELGELTGDYPVENTGQVWVPRVGAVEVAGLTVDEMRARLRTAASRVSTVSNAITATPILNVAVLGAVRQPASVVVPFGSTVFDAISGAHGFEANADLDNITVIRSGSSIRLSGRAEGGPTSIATFPLQSGDRITVGARRRVTQQTVFTILQALTLAVTIYSVSRN